MLELRGPGRKRLVSHMPESGKFEIKAPPGDYDLHGYGDYTDVESIRRELTLRSGSSVMELGLVPLKAAPIALHYGKPAPPWHITAARGVPEGFQLSDLRGRWVLVEFWGFW